MEPVSAILLGAGQSKRMGVNKLLLPWGKRTIFQQCFATLMRSNLAEVIVVLGPRTKELRDRLGALRSDDPSWRTEDRTALFMAGRGGDPVRKGRKAAPPTVKVRLNPSFIGGMSRSVRVGVRAVSEESRGILIALGDMPRLKERTINLLLDRFEERGGIVIPCFRGRRGHPAIFHKKYERELLGLTGDAGARSVVARHPEDVTFIKVKSEGVIQDVDTWSDYKSHYGSGIADAR
jgi:molybdenum cofactor cytidylyltransferase